MSLLVEDNAPVAAEKPDDVEMEIIRIAMEVPTRADAEKWGNKLWTKNLIFPLGQLGKQLGYYVCAARSLELEKDQGAWLYDLAWLEYSDGNKCLIGLPLILESEWSARDGYIDDDFQKLLVARAEHRVMICQGSDPDRHFKRFAKQVRNCGLTQAGDRYLLLCLDLNDHKFKFRVFIA
jgi:hypothetical protein